MNRGYLLQWRSLVIGTGFDNGVAGRILVLDCLTLVLDAIRRLLFVTRNCKSYLPTQFSLCLLLVTLVSNIVNSFIERINKEYIELLLLSFLTS